MTEPNAPMVVMRAAMSQLDALLQMAATDRALRLNELSVSDPRLHALLLQLLAAEREASGSGFLEPPRVDVASALAPGAQIGPYRILRQLGAGGMGEVWLAEAIDPHAKSVDAIAGGESGVGQVAIKTLHPHLANTALRDRFSREAHILGKLTHKNIARLYDAGVSETGTAYLVLEYVHGETIDEWSDARSLSIRARLELFLSVCNAVAHAHAHLVVHRDLKPSNILVAKNGGVKLLDFGVAKLVQGDDSNIEPTALTQFGGRIFTPEYASPEQVLGQTVTTATDVFALGVLLYGLLAGFRPFGATGATGRELEQAILNTEPAALTKIPGDRVDDIARRRSTTPAKLVSALRGDLEHIVARALRKSPKERYGSVLAFAVDIERYLRQQPIEARAGSNFYRFGRLVQRHRAATLATVISVVALVAGSGVALWQAQVARNEARKATAIKDFLVGVFERNSVAHPDGASARKTTAEELLAQSAAQIRTEMTDVPEVRAEMLGIMAGLYGSLEMQKESIELREAELQELRRAHGDSSAEVANAMTWLARSQNQFGDYTAGTETATRAAEILARLGDDTSLDAARAQEVLGQGAFRAGKIQDGTASRHYDAALRIIEQHHPRASERIEVLMSKARIATLVNDPEGSLRACQQALDLIERNEVDVSGFERAAVYQVMSVRLRGVYRYDDALKMIERSTQEFERAGGPDHPFTIDSRRDHGTLRNLLGQRAEGQQLIAQAVVDLERTKGVDDPELTANARIVLGQVMTVRGAFGDAEPQLAHALRVTTASDSTILATATRVMQARIYTAQGRFEDSARTLEGIEKVSIGISGEGSLRHALALTRLGQFELARGNLEQAQQYFDKLYGWAEKPDAMSSGRANAGVGLVRIELERGNVAMALTRARELLSQIEASKERPTMLDPESDARMVLGAALRKSGDSAAALPYLQQAVDNREKMDVPQSPWLAEARLLLAQALKDQKNEAAARQQLELAQRAYEANPKLAPPFRKVLTDTRHHLAN